MNIGIIRYPGSNCDIETKTYFSDLGECFYIWHKEEDESILNDVILLVLPGGFAFGDRIYNKATEQYQISPGTMALNSPVSKIIKKAVSKKIPIIGICNGFQILTQMELLPGSLIMNETGKFICDRVKCNINYKDINYNTTLCIANTYGKYVKNNNISSEKIKNFLIYENGEIAGVCDTENKIFGMMPHPERNNYDFKHILYKIIFDDEFINSQFYFDKCLKDLMFSEHISYKTTRKYLKNLHTNEDWVVQGPGENAGIVDIGKDKNGNEYCIALRIESHNHPTFINPFEGAATGVGGILRDIFTMGARPIAILDFLRFGTDDNSKRLLDGAIKGISYYGNCVGVANVGGDLKYHKSYNCNPLVNVACLGIVKKDNIVYGNALTDNNSFLIYVGSKTGNEGINGAAMASNVFSNNNNMSELEKNVQKSDPFLEKLLLEACCEISELNLAEGMQDMGAGGLLCASLEVIKRGREKTSKNIGCTILLKNVPTKYEMEPANILISESQERMLIVCKKENIEKICEIFKKWDLEHAIIGNTNKGNKYSIFKNNVDCLYSQNIDSFDDVNDYSNVINNNIQNYNFKEKEPIKNTNHDLWKVYDSTVGNRTIKGPEKSGKYSILDIYEVNKQLVITWGESFMECYDTIKLFEGVKPLCLVNCLNYGDPKFSLNDIVETINDLSKHCKEYHIPVVGGNVSLYNTTEDVSIRPTPILVMIGITR
tara:strand:- start:158 stop:2305 length:2148 start_codon:yes stop_codon:yes gene_type:complete